jgi:D-glycero-D-manno-heptose 1,7-bisphosphate phosphatase
MQSPKRKAIFLDRDGVLNVDLGYTYKLNDLKLVDGMIDGLKSLLRGDYVFVMITNQSGIARGMFTAAQVESFNNELLRQIQCEIPNFKFDAVMICPHHPEGVVSEFTIDCKCRKPGIKLVTEAASKLNLDLVNSWIIGDKISQELLLLGIHVHKKTVKRILLENGKNNCENRTMCVATTLFHQNLCN